MTQSWTRRAGTVVLRLVPLALITIAVLALFGVDLGPAGPILLVIEVVLSLGVALALLVGYRRARRRGLAPDAALVAAGETLLPAVAVRALAWDAKLLRRAADAVRARRRRGDSD